MITVLDGLKWSEVVLDGENVKAASCSVDMGWALGGE